MHKPLLILVILLAAAVLCGSTSLGLAQPPQGRGQGQPRYDIDTETTVTGTVEAVEQVQPPSGGRGQGGTHLVLQTDTEALEIHLGPTAYLTREGLVVAAGDTVEVVGSQLMMNDEQVLIARQVTKGDDTWTLRDASGRPMWRRGRR